MCLFWRSPTAWSPESASGDFVLNLAIAYSGKLEIGTRQLNYRRLLVPPDFLPNCQPGALSTRLHCNRMPRHRIRPPGRYKCEFKNNICWRDFSSTSIHFERKLYLLFTGISSPAFSTKFWIQIVIIPSLICLQTTHSQKQVDTKSRRIFLCGVRKELCMVGQRIVMNFFCNRSKFFYYHYVVLLWDNLVKVVW